MRKIMMKPSSTGQSMNRRQVTKFLGATAAMALSLPAGRARAADSVNFLGWQGYDDPVIFDGWAESKGITLNTTYIGNNDEIVAKLRGGGVGQIDIVTPFMGYVPLLVKLDLIQPIDVSRVPNLEKVMPFFRDEPSINVDGKLYAVPFTWGAGPMVYDPSVIPVAPESWRDLLKPELAGKVGMLDNANDNIAIAALVSPGVSNPSRLTPTELETAIDFLIEIKKQCRVVSTSFGDLADSLARGDVAATFGGWEAMVKFCADKGKVVEYTYPKERTTAWLDSYCIAKDAPSVDAAYELCNRVIDTAPQKRLAESAFQGIVSTEAANALPPETKALYPYDNIAEFDGKAGFFGLPPVESDSNDVTTLSQWLKAYERFKIA